MIDFAKAFNMIWWDSVDIMLEAFGFDEVFRELVMSCIHMTSFSTMVEGSPSDVFQPERGLPQGDPLCLILFIMVVEFLVQLM